MILARATLNPHRERVTAAPLLSGKGRVSSFRYNGNPAVRSFYTKDDRSNQREVVEQKCDRNLSLSLSASPRSSRLPLAAPLPSERGKRPERGEAAVFAGYLSLQWICSGVLFSISLKLFGLG